MSGQSFPQKFDGQGQRMNHLQSEPIPFAVASPHQLAQFSAATAGGYYPRPQTLPATFPSGSSSQPTNTSQPAKPTTTPAATTKPLSEFAASAYQAAEQGHSGLQPPPPQSIDLATFKGFKFVTLDGFQLETREIYDLISGTFKWEMCESQDDRCMKFVREQCANKRVFLISSGSLGRRVVPAIHDLPQIYAIYIYCADVPSNLEWSKQWKKVRVVCNDDDKYLLPQLAVDVAQANIEWGDALLKANQRDKAKEKYDKAWENLKQYTKDPGPDPVMVNSVKSKLEQCK
jgi:hypothetical protein